jgi:hypothetical protein
MNKIILVSLLCLLVFSSCNPISSLSGDGQMKKAHPTPGQTKPDVSAPPEPVDDMNQERPLPDTPGLPDPSQSKGKNFRSGRIVQSADLVIMESYPPQIKVVIKGELPNPCYTLDLKTSPADEKNRIMITVTSTVNQDLICTEVIAPFEETILLNMAGEAEGTYSVWLNGQPIGEFEWKG